MGLYDYDRSYALYRAGKKWKSACDSSGHETTYSQ